jgi:D-alanyl-D-alanine carboxypeptidase
MHFTSMESMVKVMKTGRKVIILAVWTMLLSNVVSASEPNETLLAKLQKIADQWIAESKLPGAIVSVTLPDGTTLTAASGYADKERDFKMLPSHRLHSGSFAKTFVAALALELRNEGKVDLDASISRYVGGEPWFRALPDGESITLRQLLGMRTGLTAGSCIYDPDTGEPCLYDPVLLESLWAEYRPRYAYPEIFRFVPMWRRPLLKSGEFIYTDEQYILAGVILEKAAGEKIEEAIQRRFIYPFQLLLTGPSDSRVIPGLAKGYSDNSTRKRGIRAWQGDAVVTDGVLDINYGYPFTSGHYFTNPQDLARWVRILYSGKAMGGAYLRDMFTFSKTNSQGIAYGLAVMRIATKHGLAYEHDGGMPGYMTMAAYYADNDFSVAAQANQRSGDHLPAIRDRLADCVASFLHRQP